MSWCTVAEIGKAATLRHVKIAATVWEGAVGPYALFAPSGSWEVKAMPQINAARTKWTIDVGFKCLQITELLAWRYGQFTAMSGLELNGRYLTFDEPTGFWLDSLVEFEITGQRGTATLQDLDATDELVAGQSVLRSGEMVLIEEDENALADDQLIVPPALLNSAAITVARRVIQMETDQTSTFDDSTYGVANRLVDGWIEPVQEFLK